MNMFPQWKAQGNEWRWKQNRNDWKGLERIWNWKAHVQLYNHGKPCTTIVAWAIKGWMTSPNHAHQRNNWDKQLEVILGNPTGSTHVYLRAAGGTVDLLERKQIKVTETTGWSNDWFIKIVLWSVPSVIEGPQTLLIYAGFPNTHRILR